MEDHDTGNPYLLKTGTEWVDVSMLYEVAGNDLACIKAIVSTFLKTVPVTLQKMEDSLLAEDYDGLYKAAHYSKSSLSIIKVSDALEIAQMIEKRAKSQSEIETLPELLETLKGKIERAEEVLSVKFEIAA